jgi:hypothetical protein
MSNGRLSNAGCVAVLIAMIASARPAVGGGLAPGAVVCLHPVQLPFAVGAGDVRRASIEQRLVAALRRESFDVVDPERVAALHERVLTAAGGFVDAATGMIDTTRRRTFHDRVARAFASELGCAVQLVPSVVAVRASFQNGFAEWDGTKQQVSSTGRIVLNAIAGTIESGWVGAFSLWLRLLDLQGDEIGFRSAGIEAVVQLAVLEDKDLLPDDQWLTDGTKLDAAIGSALGASGSALRTSSGAD